tara:strand:+ start:1173 stop:1634 length:462 start_codon:yes stop_codon:yes gene_type:complete
MNKLKLLVYDFDGVMTDNKVYIDQNGIESVQVNRADGLGVSEIKKLGLKQLIISTEKNSVVGSRAEKLKIPFLQGIDDKKSSLIKYCKEINIDLRDVGFVGNDINDKEVMEIVGVSICPYDAHKDIIHISDKILKSKGGDGVVREILDLIINK